MPLGARWSAVLAVFVLLLSACDSGSPGPTPVSVVISAGDNQSATVGSILSNLQIEVRDAEGVAIGGLTFSVAVQSGGGTYLGTVTKTIKGAPTPLGTWTLGTTAGPQTLRITAGSLGATITANSQAGAPASAEVGAGAGAPITTTGGVGGIASIQPSVRLRDSFGNAVVGRSVTVAITGGGTVANPNPVTDANGVASVGVWTLGTVSGAQRVTLSGGGVTPVVFTADVAPGAPTQVAVFNAPAAGLAVNSQISNIEFAVQDQFGNGIPQQPVTFSMLSGSGSITIASANTNAQGRVSPGTWRLGTLVGLNELRATAGGFQQTVSVTTVPGAATSIAVVAGASQTATVNTVVPVAPVFALRDAFGNGIAGQTMAFSVVSGGGALTTLSAVTAAETGEASPGTWTLGSTVGSQTIRATVGALSTNLSATGLASGGGGGGGSSYTVDIRIVGPTPPASVTSALATAKARLEQAITGDLTDIPAFGIDVAADCNIAGAPVLNEMIDDLVVFVLTAPRDGPLNNLAAAGPCYTRNSNGIPVIGVMLIDSDDVAFMNANGILAPVLLHELLHVVGIGTRWQPSGLLPTAGTADPLYIGAQGRAAYVAAGGSAPVGVPVENTGGAGTRDGHWRKTVFDNELMTGFASATMPFSAVSIRSLVDLGYQVNAGVADPFTITPPGLRALRVPEVVLVEDVIMPRFQIGPLGDRRALSGRRDE